VRIGEETAARLTVPATATPAERLDRVERALGSEVLLVGPKLLPAAAAGLGMLVVAGRLLGEDATATELQTVLRGLPHNVTTEMDLALWDAGHDDPPGRIGGAPRPRRACRRAGGGLPRGGRCRPWHSAGYPTSSAPTATGRVAEIDLGISRWSDDPAHVLGVLANYLRLDDPALAPDAVFARGAAEAERMIETLVDRARRRGPLRARLVRFALDRARQLAGLREIPKYFMIVSLGALRRELALVGAELARRGRSTAPRTSSSWTWSRHGPPSREGTGASGVAARRQAYDAELRRRHVPSVILSDGTEPEAATLAATAADGAPRGDGRLRGDGSPPRRASSWTRWARIWSPARSWWRRPRTRDGRRCS
jgi:pyruvate,water dikinase